MLLLGWILVAFSASCAHSSKSTDRDQSNVTQHHLEREGSLETLRKRYLFSPYVTGDAHYSVIAEEVWAGGHFTRSVIGLSLNADVAYYDKLSVPVSFILGDGTVVQSQLGETNSSRVQNASFDLNQTLVQAGSVLVSIDTLLYRIEFRRYKLNSTQVEDRVSHTFRMNGIAWDLGSEGNTLARLSVSTEAEMLRYCLDLVRRSSASPNPEIQVTTHSTSYESVALRRADEALGDNWERWIGAMGGQLNDLESITVTRNDLRYQYGVRPVQLGAH
jgi:hypothetical protein